MIENKPEPGRYGIEFPQSWGIYRTHRASMRAALQVVANLEALRGMVAERIVTPNGRVIEREDIKVFLEKFGVTATPATKENRGKWIVVFEYNSEIDEHSFADQLQALRYIAAGEDMKLIRATEIVTPTGHIMDRAGIDAALKRNGLDLGRSQPETDGLWYLCVRWEHGHPGEPTYIASEVDNAGYETRKVHLFRGGVMEWADRDHETDRTGLGEKPVGSVEEINALDGFTAETITKEAFEAAWAEARKQGEQA